MNNDFFSFLLTANWDGFHDNETGILGYMWASDIEVCGEGTVAYQDPHSHIYQMSEWTHEGIEVDLDLPGTNKLNMKIYGHVPYV